VTVSISPSRPGRLAWLALLSLASIAVVLGGGAWLSIQTGQWGTAPRQLVDACLLVSHSISHSVWEKLWSAGAIHPLSAAALVLLGASMAWASLRLGLSLALGWQGRGRRARYETGRFPALDRVLRVSPDVARARIRIIRSATPDAFTVGLVRPKICLSEGFLEGAPDAEIDAVLHHEHAHVEARDPLRLAAVRLLSDFLWFLPIARTLARAFSATAELRADEAAVSAGSDPLELASAIVKTAGGASLKLRLAAAVGGPALLEHRVLRLLGRKGTSPLRIASASSLGSGLMLLALLVSLVAPALARAGGSPVDVVAEMSSMTDHMMTGCEGPEEATGFSPSMMADHCTERGHVAPGTDQASGGLNAG
jgi:Zn-dependent protease with chaperone function